MVGEAIQSFWAEYGSIITAVLGSGLDATIMAFIANLVAKIIANKATKTFDVNKIIAEVTERVTQNLAKNLTGSVLDVDISAVVESKLDEVLGEITVQVKDVKAAVDSMKECSALTAKAVGKSKLLDKTEQAALVAEAEKLSESVTRAEKPVTKIKIEAKQGSTFAEDGAVPSLLGAETAAVGAAVSSVLRL